MNIKDLEDLRAKEAKAMENTLLIDILDELRRKDYNMEYIDHIARQLGQLLKLEIQYVDKLINPYTPFEKLRKAKTAVRLSKKPHSILLVTDEAHSAETWVKTYSDKGIHTYVYHVDAQVILTSEEYLTDFAKELLLDTIMKLRHSENRPYLEDLADSFADALGWTFSGPIHEQAATASMLDKLKPYELLPSAGFKGNYSFPETVHAIGDTFMEDDIAPSGKMLLHISRKTIASTGRAVPVSELQAFNEYVTALIEAHMLEDMLIDGYTLCECGHPIRTSGNTHEDAYCPYCDKAIPNFEVFTFDRLAYDGYLTYSRVNED